MAVTFRAAQGSDLGLDIWNVAYDSLLPEETLTLWRCDSSRLYIPKETVPGLEDGSFEDSLFLPYRHSTICYGDRWGYPYPSSCQEVEICAPKQS